jgi:uncharacterized protein
LAATRRRRDAIERLHGSVQTGATEYHLVTESSAVFSAQERSRGIEPTRQTLKYGRIVRRMLRQYANAEAGSNASFKGVPKAPAGHCESSRSGPRNDNHNAITTGARKMKRLTLASGLCLLAIGALHADERYAQQKVVYHLNVDDAETQVAALRNIQNHIDAVGVDNIEVKVVMHGDGISLLVEPDALEGTKMKAANADADMAARIDGLKQQGVAFEVCANTLKGRDVEMDDMYGVSEADIVPSGVAELSRLQQQGYTYIKP